MPPAAIFILAELRSADRFEPAYLRLRRSLGPLRAPAALRNPRNVTTTTLQRTQSIEFGYSNVASSGPTKQHLILGDAHIHRQVYV
jgi:hypothetical protein